MGRRVAVFSSTSQPTNRPTSQPTAYLTKYSKWNISATTDQIFLKYNGRRPQNIKIGISHKQLIGSSSKLKLNRLGSDQN
jgi:hypothetical protein